MEGRRGRDRMMNIAAAGILATTFGAVGAVELSRRQHTAEEDSGASTQPGNFEKTPPNLEDLDAVPSKTKNIKPKAKFPPHGFEHSRPPTNKNQEAFPPRDRGNEDRFSKEEFEKNVHALALKLKGLKAEETTKRLIRKQQINLSQQEIDKVTDWYYEINNVFQEIPDSARKEIEERNADYKYCAKIFGLAAEFISDHVGG